MVEMTLKTVVGSGPARPPIEHVASGREYLTALRRLRREREVDPAFRTGVSELLLGLAEDHRWRPRDDGSWEVAFLIARNRLGEIVAKGAELKASFPSIPFLLSGPWPLEVFGDEA